MSIRIRTWLMSLTIVTAGFGVGAIGGEMLSPAPALAAEACENDECDDYCTMWGCTGECEDNEGGGTACDVVGDDDCQTTGC